MWFPCLLLSGAARHTRKLRFVRRSTAGVCCWCEVKLRPDGSPFLAMYLATVDARELRSSLLPPNAQDRVRSPLRRRLDLAWASAPPARQVLAERHHAIFAAMTFGRQASRATLNVLTKVSTVQAAM